MRIRDRVRKILKRKSPWLAALLNLMPGLGYLYAGKKKLLGLSLVAFIWTWITAVGRSMSQGGIHEISPFLLYWASIGAPLFMLFAFARDAYLEIKEENKRE
ncbi:hypothetical protein AKJ37_00840 [candidate division MSBL1 archaeon SCGC-AAA259I09]|uniref:DUF5683 domain-containing protein n=1 Tax=candidate division MSBL1 archaeon SCGC-AAA259I09 TaxID=1698267 RepID=A0A133UVR1_9EURY|nr:hypothetical protein AKJ37_00840 [candidate division MSBL1 archaeon SCGC-AAA259I09]